MKTHPILFNGEMVRALLNGRKTQTRRVMKPQPKLHIGTCDRWDWETTRSAGFYMDIDGLNDFSYFYCPYGKMGDLIWVRETVMVLPEHWEIDHEKQPVYYSCDKMKAGVYKTVPSIFMPRWASRLTLKITDIRAERVQDISGKDAVAEGIYENEADLSYCIAEYAELWDSINAKRGYGWDENPWVWVVEFKVIHRNIDDELESNSE